MLTMIKFQKREGGLWDVVVVVVVGVAAGIKVAAKKDNGVGGGSV